MRRIPFLTLSFAFVVKCHASISASVDKLDATDGLPLPPPHIVVIDLYVQPSSDDAWAETGMYGEPANGVQIALAQDPNSGDPLFTAPGAANRFVTFFSKPRERDANNRFGSGAAIIPLGYAGPPVPQLTPTRVSVSAVESNAGPLGLSGYVARVAIDLSTALNPSFRQDSANIVVAQTAPADSQLLFECRYGGAGTFIASRNAFTRQFNWGVYGIIPEPATIAAFALLSLFALRARV